MDMSYFDSLKYQTEKSCDITEELLEYLNPLIFSDIDGGLLGRMKFFLKTKVFSKFNKKETVILEDYEEDYQEYYDDVKEYYR